MDIREIISWAAAFGLPSIFVMTSWCVRKCKAFSKSLQILMEAQQKQMARDLSMDYKEYIKQGWIDDDDLDIWEQNYQKYHALGANGIMDVKRSKLLSLPNVPPTSKKGNSNA